MSAEAPDIAPAVPPAARPARRRRRLILGAATGAAILAIACALSLVFGSRVVSWDEIVGGLTGPDPSSFAELAVANRVPRTMLAVLVGAALGLAGALMQGITRNPLADPGLLGINMGASLSVVIGIVFFGLAGTGQYAWFALAGGGAAALLVYAVGSVGGRGATPLRLAIAGAATSAVLSSLVSAVLLLRTDVFDTFRFWQVGGVGGASTADIAPVLPILVAGLVLAFLSGPGLDVLSLGDELAKGLGGAIGISRLTAGVAAVLLAAGATALAGPIAFVGLVVPHAARVFTGPNHRWLLPYAALLGAGLLVLADVVGRVVSRPADIPVGIMAAVIGGPVFIWLIRRAKVRDL